MLHLATWPHRACIIQPTRQHTKNSFPLSLRTHCPGPVTFVLLAQRQLPAEEAVSRLLPAYGQLLRQLQVAGAPEVQIHEPILATDKVHRRTAVHMQQVRGRAILHDIGLPSGSSMQHAGDRKCSGGDAWCNFS